MERPTLRNPVSSRDHTIGPENAPVTLVEYGDYECPHCGKAESVVRGILTALDRSVRYVFRNFPLRQSHPHAESAAEAAEAAGVQGKFWEMHDLLFRNQGALGRDDLMGYARRLGLDIDRFSRELIDGTFAIRIREEIRSGLRSGVNGTPTFFINDIRYDGPVELNAMLAELRAEIARRETRQAG